MGEKLKFKTWADILKADDGILLDMKDYGLQSIGNSLDGVLVMAQAKLEREIKRRLKAGISIPRSVARHYNDVTGGIWVEVEVMNHGES